MIMGSTFIKESVSAYLCNRMIEKAFAKATELKMGIAVTIVDESGVAKAFQRMDNAPLVAIDASRKKAVTAIGFGMPTGDSWYNFIKDDPILMHGADQLKDFMLLGGGSPIMIDEKIVGAIGVSGGHYKQDEVCVNAALTVLNDNV